MTAKIEKGSGTARTDIARMEYAGYKTGESMGAKEYPDGWNFARILERELTAATEKVKRYEYDLCCHETAIKSAESRLSAAVEENARLEAKVRNAEGYQEELANQTREAQQDHTLLSNDYKNICVDLKNAQAKLAAMREALQGLHDDIAAYVKVNHLGDVHHNLSMLRARQTLEYTATQSTLFVDALRDRVIEEMAAIVDERHDPCEPWMDGDDLRALKSSSPKKGG